MRKRIDIIWVVIGSIVLLSCGKDTSRGSIDDVSRGRISETQSEKDLQEFSDQDEKSISEMKVLSGENEHVFSEYEKNDTTTAPEKEDTVAVQSNTDDNVLFIQFYTDDVTQEKIGISVKVEDDNSKMLTMVYFPSDTDAEYPVLYEMKCYSIFGLMSVIGENREPYAISIQPQNNDYEYCKIVAGNNGDIAVIETYDRDGTKHSSSTDHKMADWIDECGGVVETSSVIWMMNLVDTIDKDLENVYH